MSSLSSIPDFVERKGSLFLRSDHMEYGRATLVSNWHQTREAEPMDNRIKRGENLQKRQLHLSTYNRLGNVTSEHSPISTSHDQMAEAVRLKVDFQPRVTKVPMLNQENVEAFKSNRDYGHHNDGRYGSVLPRHPPDHNKRYLDTTHKVDFQPPYPYEPKTATKEDSSEPGAVWKKCHSQFTDVDDYRRHGNNTWHDQSGRYGNRELRATVVPKTDTIPSRLL